MARMQWLACKMRQIACYDRLDPIRYGSGFDQVGIGRKNARVHLLVAFVDLTAHFYGD